jgi:RHH-type proline utilization regulon transcriptional repressor/proline dehydrogenase/delta 1-pyrroline-5-carboxylate dehydrogenase
MIRKMKTYPDPERRIQEVGRELYASMNKVPSLFDKKRWMGRTMDLAMRDDEFKLNLFRYIDVLPSLRTDSLVVELFREYFGGIRNAPLIIRKGIDRMSKGFIPFVTARVIRAGVKTLARQFIAGEDLHEASKSLESLWGHGCAGSVDLLGEEVLSDREAAEYREKYLGLLDFLGPASRTWEVDPVIERDHMGPIPRFDISLKVSSLYSQLDPLDWERSVEKAKENLMPIIKKAGEEGASVCFDMEQYYMKDLTIEIFRQTFADAGEYHFGGIALQAYLEETARDLPDLIAWAKERKRPIRIRLVKGAYWDYEVVFNRQKGWPVPVFLNKGETDRNFEKLTRTLLENADTVRPAIASHNIRSISNAIATAEALGLPKHSFEFQMLFGMGEPLRKALREMGYRVRVYAPAGELIPGMAYLVRRLLENTSNVSFLRELFAEGKQFTEIIKPPEVTSGAPEESKSGGFTNEPARDFSKAVNRERMRQALDASKKDFGDTYPLLIGGEKVYTEREIVSLNPAQPQGVVGRVSSAAHGEAEKAITQALKASADWRKTPPPTRALYLFKAAEELRKRREELAALEVYEVGKTWRDADGDIIEAIDYLEYYGREMVRLGGALHPGNYPGEMNDYFYEPRGIGVVISPWNFPLAIPAGMVSAGIVTGNCVIFKPSGLSPVTGWRLVEAFRNAGLPPGVLQFLPAPGHEVGEYLVAHESIDFIAFTGSKDVGLRIVTLAAGTKPGQRNVKRVIAEMGGKNAIIVDETAEPDETVKGVLESALGYQGQKCSACSRVIVIEEIYEEFLTRLKAAVESIRIGPPDDPGTFMGPVIDEAAMKKIRWYIGSGKSDAVLFLERKAGGNGYFLGPVIFRDVVPSSVIAQEEIFGPVLSVIGAKDIDDAIAIANGTRYALTGGLFSRSPKNIRKVREEFRVGNLYINRKITGALVGRQPFGGTGMSGVGSKAGGPDYLLQFMNPRSTSENTMRRGFAPL